MKLSVGIIMLALTACGQAPDNATAITQNVEQQRGPGPKIAWKDGPEKSVYTIEADENRTQVRRCWKRPEGVDCLHASGYGAMPSMFSYIRYKRSNLPVEQFDSSIYPDAGYWCNVTDNNIISERLSAPERTIEDRLTALDGSVSTNPLTRAETIEVLHRNGVSNGGPYFDCPAIAATVAKNGGDVTNITTTAITYDEVMR